MLLFRKSVVNGLEIIWCFGNWLCFNEIMKCTIFRLFATFVPFVCSQAKYERAVVKKIQHRGRLPTSFKIHEEISG